MAAKTKTVYVCRECGAESPKWMGRCNQCGEWNTFTEEQVVVSSKSSFSSLPDAPLSSVSVKPMVLSEVVVGEVQRSSTANAELDRVLGGGIVSGALILIGGALVGRIVGL